MRSPVHTAPSLDSCADIVVLVSDDGTATGTAPRTTVHGPDTPLHLAFSTYLFDDTGRLLLTRRSLAKVAWPGVWTNSSCGHLRPGEDALHAATRRVPEELGAAPRDLRVVLPGFRYHAQDAGGVVEHELCPVLVGRIDPSALAPDPAEVAETTWATWTTVLDIATHAPQLISPWAALQIPALAQCPGLPTEGMPA